MNSAFLRKTANSCRYIVSVGTVYIVDAARPIYCIAVCRQQYIVCCKTVVVYSYCQKRLRHQRSELCFLPQSHLPRNSSYDGHGNSKRSPCQVFNIAEFHHGELPPPQMEQGPNDVGTIIIYCNSLIRIPRLAREHLLRSRLIYSRNTVLARFSSPSTG